MTEQQRRSNATSLELWATDRGRRRRAWAATVVAASSQFLYMLDSGLVAISLPEIERSFDEVSRSTLGWIAGAFMVAQSSMLLVGGRLGDRHGRKRFFLLGLATFCVGGLLSAISPTIWLLIAARTLQGVGAGFLTSGALALVLPMFPSAKSAVVIGAWGVVGAVGALATPLLAPLVVEQSWRLAFFLVAPFGLVAIWLGRRLLVDTEPDRSKGPTDRIGYLLGPPALGLTVLVVSRGGRWGWASAPTLGAALAAALLLAAFLRRSVVAASPLLDLGIFRYRWFGANLLAGFAQQMGFFSWWLTAPLIMSEVWGWSVREIGLALAAAQVTGMIGSPAGGQLVVRFGQSIPIVIGAALIVGSQAWLLATAGTTPDVWRSYAPAALVFGLGCGLCGTVTTGAGLAALPSATLGAGNSIIQLVRRTGGALGVTLGIGLLGEASGDALLAGAQRVWILCIALHVVVVVPIFVMHARPQIVRNGLIAGTDPRRIGAS